MTREWMWAACRGTPKFTVYCTALALWVLVASGAFANATDLESAIQEVFPQVVTTYETIHRMPELGNVEYNTHKLIADLLSNTGFTHFEVVSSIPTAIIAVLDTGRPGPTFALRAELDARPTQESADHILRSQTAGVMHNCGHDAHAAMLLGAAVVLREHSNWLNGGRVVFIFQPAEEIRGGADDIMSDGVLRRLGVSSVFAQHVVPGLPVGTVVLSRGAAMAGSTYFELKLTGRGSHAATPAAGSDVPLVAAKLALALAELPARRLDILSLPTVISITHISVGRLGALNVLPTEAILGGTIRSFESLEYQPSDSSHSVSTLINQVVSGIELAYGVGISLSISPGSPPTINSEDLRVQVEELLVRNWPELRFLSDAERSMFSEDFAYYTTDLPCLYFGLGVAKGHLGMASVHSPNFTLHSDALVVGTRLLVELAIIRSALSN